jgi:hypothetical protein
MKKFVAFLVFIGLLVGGGWYFWSNKKGAVLQGTVHIAKDVLKFSKLDDKMKSQFGVVTDIINGMLANDGIKRKYLVLLQNSYELRPGGGFLGQYGVFEIKDGEILSYEIIDSNILDNSYKSDRLLPVSLQKYLSDTKKMKFRDSNYSPHFPINVEDAKHFYSLAGKDADFDGVFAVNSIVFEDLLEITGPILVREKDYEKYGEFTSTDGLMKLQKIVEEPVFRADERKKCENVLKKLNVSREDDRWEDCRYDKNGKKKKKMTHGQRATRKYILQAMAKEIVPKILKVKNIEPMIKVMVNNLNNKNVQLWFKNTELNKIAQEADWAGEVDEKWAGDYLMISDANVGALKSDFYVRRALEYKVDFTGRSGEKNDVAAGRMVRYISPDVKEQVMSGTFVTARPLATARMIYENTATEASYFNMDYHSLTRLYVPNGSKWYIREWFEPPSVEQGVFGDKQVYTYKFDVLLGKKIPTMLQYTLPARITEQGYRLKIQKQSGIGDIPVKVTIITSDGTRYVEETTFTSDLIFELKDNDLVLMKK